MQKQSFRSPVLLAIFIVMASLSACGGGSDGADGHNGLNALPAASVEAAGSNCAAGGTKVSAGLDANGNGILEASEVSSVQYVCNGGAGSSGITGAAGVAGAAGLASLVTLTPEPAGANCSTGGSKVAAGLDANRNSVLDPSEISSVSYVCQGINGASGSTGAPGSPGLSSLMAIVPEAPGANCTYGGSKVSAGLDSNRNGLLDSGEATAVSYNCNGAPGPGVTWVDITTNTVQAQSNTGYLADSASPVVVTLPAAPNSGDLLEISGKGSGGWTIAQNAGQAIVVHGLPGMQPAGGSSWSPHGATRSWMSIASSSDGTRLVAGTANDQIYTSSDSGVTWVAHGGVQTWRVLASSADGNKLVAIVDAGPVNQLYTSNDSGITWVARDSLREWVALASSADGTKLVAAEQGGQLYTSTDSGVTWSPRESVRNWNAVASSADGANLVAAELGGRIYVSTDSGASWSPRDSARIWNSLASSADGNKLVAAESMGQLYTSTDSGLTWTARDSARDWGTTIASSADGSRLTTYEDGGMLYTSTDSGVTWTAGDNARSWGGVASSANGSMLAAAAWFDQIYTSIGDRTTMGVAGSLSGAQFDSITLQYMGSGLFMPVSNESYSGSFAFQ